jgi:hypothetical protein
MKIFLVSYRPLVRYPEGRIAIAKYDLPPFLDYSCRKEPDFASKYPSISALCRVDKFVPRLHKDDLVVYITSKGNDLHIGFGHWRLTAILKVKHRFESHMEAVTWYLSQDLAVPNNCMVEGNPPTPIEKTAPITAFKTNLRAWDREYQRRASKCGVFLTSEARFLELYNPPIITDEIMHQVFGRVPGTQNPPSISHEEFEKLVQLSGFQLS